MGVEEALRLWDEFPVRRAPRPIVLMDCAIGRGRLSQREQVLGHRPVVSEVGLPPGILGRLQPKYPDGSAPAVVTSVRRVWPEFRTDRGHRPLPAYRLEFAGATGDLLLLDDSVVARTWWPEGLTGRWRGGLPGMCASVVMDGGRSVRLLFQGALPSYSDVRVRAVHESRTAVLVEVEDLPHRPGSPMPLAAVGRVVMARLEQPLGARVLLVGEGVPVQVMSAG
ncbi:hypothetical protein E1263_41400 [Kribbella antibiotica]|uniref:Uncharacterized protein n=1 Tax=Kribbella antibiotica TaxID=190195 RepID=A0A4R4YG12_9ACTN|nr:hypothetical protein [Kribbella antibiotica]TDD43683.1 hypothetical protein E1263_41400 [Kribbella antibiotica]